MSKAHIKRFLTLLSSANKVEQARLYQLLYQAESCYCLKDKRGQYEFGKALSLFSFPFNVIGEYYQSLYLHKVGQKPKAYENLERAREEVKGIYTDKATLVLSGLKEWDSDLDESLNLRMKLTKSESLPIAIESTIGVAAILSSQGEHQEAIKYLERALGNYHELGNTPLKFDLQNSYAVELAEIGKIELASEVITPVAASPYTLYYPNWLETEQEIKEKSRRSTVTFNSSNVVEFPTSDKVREVSSAREPQESPYSDYIETEFRLSDKIEDWIYGGTEPDDFGTLMLALSEIKDETDRDIIISRILQSTFIHTEEGREARIKWEEKLLSKMKK